jgi:uncharacterized protein
MNNGIASESSSSESTPPAPKPLNRRQRRILGVLIEKARTTPDAYPLSLNGLVTGANQKTNRSPLMSLSAEQIEDEIIKMREAGIVAEIQGGGRVPKYRHFGYDYMGVKGVEAGIMTELLLRGEQTAGDLRSRASRFENIPDLSTLEGILKGLMARGLVIALTPAGRGQLFTHNLYLPDELSALRAQVARGELAQPPTASAATAARTEVSSDEVTALRDELKELRSMVEALGERVATLES